MPSQRRRFTKKTDCESRQMTGDALNKWTQSCKRRTAANVAQIHRFDVWYPALFFSSSLLDRVLFHKPFLLLFLELELLNCNGMRWLWRLRVGCCWSREFLAILSSPFVRWQKSSCCVNACRSAWQTSMLTQRDIIEGWVEYSEWCTKQSLCDSDDRVRFLHDQELVSSICWRTKCTVVK